MSFELHEECGVFGICNGMNSDVALQTYVALFALQHRGQESCGIAVNDDGVFRYHRDVGLVPDVFAREELDKLGHGNMALGHVRYSTTGNHNRANAQPLLVRHIKGTMSLAHNGRLVNASELREELEMGGAIFHSTTDSELMSHVIIRERLKTTSIEEAVEAAMFRLKGAYSLLVMSPRKMLAVRDPYGFRPLCMGKIGDGIVFASESCALDGIGATFVRDIDPGEIVVVSPDGIRSIRTHMKETGRLCIFEFIYFARPDSVIAGVNVHSARVRAGELLAREQPVDADVVVGVPDSGLDAALGYSRASGIPYGLGYIKNRYIGRTFIQPTQDQREQSVRIKLNTIASTVSGKRVALIDDSVVRGTTCDYIIQLLRDAGAKEVHMRIASPPYLHACHFGADGNSKDALIACRMSTEEISRHFGADSLGYLSTDAVLKIAQGASCGFCDGCFTGNYPIPAPKPEPANKYEQKLSEAQRKD